MLLSILAEVRTDTTRSLPKSDSRSRLASENCPAPESRSIAKSDSRCRLVGMEFERGTVVSSGGATDLPLERLLAAAGGSNGATEQQDPRQQQAAPAQGGEQRAAFQREISLAGYHAQPEAPPGRPAGALSDITFQPSAGQLEPIPSLAATRGSGSVAELAQAAPPGPVHVRVPSVDSGAGRRHHVKSFSGDSGRGLSPSDGRSSPAPWSGRSTPTRRPAASGPEALLAHKLADYLDGRSISSVVPVATPNDTSEPQLLGMSPEQARGLWWCGAAWSPPRIDPAPPPCCGRSDGGGACGLQRAAHSMAAQKMTG